ncbi:MAG: polynucleotide 3-phosphatase [Bryobacterales bacterium]|nr:polynucleotide 3-phosphatase [Bryobacterales bacterium]
MLLIGASGSGKSTFARKHFKTTEIVSSDALRAAVSDDEADQSASADAFQLLHLIVAKRLRRGRLTVVDATNVQAELRRSLLHLTEPGTAPATAIVLNLPVDVCVARNESRPDRRVRREVIEQQTRDLLGSLPGLAQEGFQHVYVLDNPQDIDSASILRQPS